MVYATCALSFCAWIVQSSRYIEMLSTNHISIARLLQFTSYLSIDIVAVILPISLSISAAFVFLRFRESNQQIALEAAGISSKTMLYPLMLLATIMSGYLYLNNALISPNAWRAFRNEEYKIKHNIDPPEGAGTIFTSGGFSIYAQKYLGDLYFGNIFIIDARLEKKIDSFHAKIGTIKNNMLFLFNGERIEIDFANNKNSITSFKKYQCDLNEILKIEKKISQPNEEYMRQLLLEDQNCDAGKIRTRIALFHQKMTSPMLPFIFSMMAFLLILRFPYSRKISYLPMAYLIATVIIFQGVYFWIVNASAGDARFIYFNYGLIFAAICFFYRMIADWEKINE